MTFEQFVGQVQHRARLASTGQAVHIIHATLQTLGERLYGDEANNLAAQLPQEIGAYLREAEVRESMTLREFYQRVALREALEYPDAVYHARSVISVLLDAVSAGEIADVRAQLPAEYNELFSLGRRGGRTPRSVKEG